MNNTVTPSQAVPETAHGPFTVHRVEIGLHLFLLIAGCLVLGFSIGMRTGGETKVFLPGTELPLPELCTSKRVFGIDCPGCGLTRGFISISHGEFQRAWHFNPASFVVYVLVIGQIPWQLYQLGRIWRGRYPVSSNWIYLLPALAAASLLLQWLVQICFPL
ncbi:MAG: DUF2752 domain-containing protein [Mariniblastus sp.]|nr:DUF2752 domain-containing protein [Mariniblastus sp.]